MGRSDTGFYGVFKTFCSSLMDAIGPINKIDKLFNDFCECTIVDNEDNPSQYSS